MNAESNHSADGCAGSRQDPELDRSIHDLFERAMSATPPTPQLPLRGAASSPSGHRRSPWLLPAIGGLAAASVLIGVVIVASQGDDTTTVIPATSPQTVAPTVAPTAPSSASVETAVTEPTPVRASNPDVSELPPLPPLPVTPVESLNIAVVSNVGLNLHADGEVSAFPHLSLSVALPDGNGGIYYLRGDAEFPTIEYMNLATSGRQTLVTPAAGVGLRLHSLTSTGFLYSENAGSDPETTRETLLHFDVASGNRRTVGDIGGWESGSSQLHQAGDLIVGTWYAEASHGLNILSAVGGPSDVSAAHFGLEESYLDCTDCPSAFGMTNDASRLLWVDGTTLVVAAVNSGTTLSRTDLPQLADSAFVSGIQVVGNLAILNHQGNTGGMSQAIVVELFDDEARVINIDLAPGHAEAAPIEGPTPPSATAAETSVTEPPPPALAVDHAALVVETGRVSYVGSSQTFVVWEGDAKTALFDQIPNVENGLRDEGAVIETLDGRIVHVRFGAEPVELFAGANLIGVPHLLDSALVAGRPKVLLTLRSPCPNIENCTETMYVLDLESGALTSHGEVGGWEEALVRATLSDDGAVVGDRWSGVVYEPFVYGVVGDVPAIPLASADPVDCDSLPCDQRLMMSPDSSVLAWQSAFGNLVINPDRVIELPDAATLSHITHHLAALQFGDDGYRVLGLDDQTMSDLSPGQITDLIER